MLENTCEETISSETTKSDSTLPSTELDSAIDAKLMTLPLKETEKEILNKIIEAPSQEILDQQVALFNMNQTKKNLVRAAKLDMLLGKIEDQAIARFDKHPDQVSNKELLDYMQVISGQIDRAQKTSGTTAEKPLITVKPTTEVNIAVGPQLDRDSKERVMDALSSLLKQVQKPVDVDEADIIDVSESEAEKSDVKSEDNTVSLNDESRLNTEEIE